MTIESGAEQCNSTNLIKVHFFYVVFILGAAIIVLATRHWTKLDGFTDFLSVAATITSLVLGVVAIIYSFVSNGALSQFLGSIQASANGMRDVNAELRSVAAGGAQLQEKAEKRNDELHEIIVSLRAAVDGVSNRTAEIAGTMESLPSRFGELREAIRERAPIAPLAAAENDLEQIWSEDRMTEFFRRTSLLGMVAIKALADASLSDKYCDLKKLFNLPEKEDFGYVYGFLVAMSAAGLLEFEHLKGDSMSTGKSRLKDMSAPFQNAIQAEWAKRNSVADAGKRKSIEKFGPRIGASMVSAPETVA